MLAGGDVTPILTALAAVLVPTVTIITTMATRKDSQAALNAKTQAEIIADLRKDTESLKAENTSLRAELDKRSRA